MNAWILVVVLSNGHTIGSPFETEKECKQAMQVVKKELKGDKKVVRIECAEGSIEPSESTGKDESFI